MTSGENKMNRLLLLRNMLNCEDLVIYFSEVGYYFGVYVRHVCRFQLSIKILAGIVNTVKKPVVLAKSQTFSHVFL